MLLARRQLSSATRARRRQAIRGIGHSSSEAAMTATLSEPLDSVTRWADEIRPLAMQRFRTPLAVQVKSDRSPVTQADREVEAAWRKRIACRWPMHGLLGEEAGAERADAEWLWVIDPIDGTSAFVTGSP